MSEKSREGVSVRDGDKSVQVIREVEPATDFAAVLQNWNSFESISSPVRRNALLSMGEKQQDGKNGSKRAKIIRAIISSPLAGSGLSRFFVCVASLLLRRAFSAALQMPRI